MFLEVACIYSYSLIHLKWLRCLPLLLTFLPSLNVVFGLYFHILCRTLSHAWSNSTPLVSISSCTYLISNLLSKHGVEHDSLLQFFILTSMCSSRHVSYLLVGCLVLVSYLCASYMLFTLWFFSWHLLFYFQSFLCHEFNI